MTTAQTGAASATADKGADKPVKVQRGARGATADKGGARKPATVAAPEAPTARVLLTEAERRERRQARRKARRDKRVNGIESALVGLTGLIESGAVKGATADAIKAIVKGLKGARPSWSADDGDDE